MARSKSGHSDRYAAPGNQPPGTRGWIYAQSEMGIPAVIESWDAPGYPDLPTVRVTKYTHWGPRPDRGYSSFEFRPLGSKGTGSEESWLRLVAKSKENGDREEAKMGRQSNPPGDWQDRDSYANAPDVADSLASTGTAKVFLGGGKWERTNYRDHYLHFRKHDDGDITAWVTEADGTKVGPEAVIPDQGQIADATHFAYHHVTMTGWRPQSVGYLLRNPAMNPRTAFGMSMADFRLLSTRDAGRHVGEGWNGLRGIIRPSEAQAVGSFSDWSKGKGRQGVEVRKEFMDGIRETYRLTPDPIRNPALSESKATSMALGIMERLRKSHGVQAGVLKSIGDGYDLFVYKLSSMDRDWRTHQYGITLTRDGQELERRVYRSDEFQQGLTHAVRNRKLGGVEYLGRASNPYPGSGCPHTHFTELSQDLGKPLAAWIERRKHGAGWPRQCEENPSNPRWIPDHLMTELANLWHLSRVHSNSRYERLLWTSKEFHKIHPELSETAIYKDLDAWDMEAARFFGRGYAQEPGRRRGRHNPTDNPSNDLFLFESSKVWNGNDLLDIKRHGETEGRRFIQATGVSPKRVDQREIVQAFKAWKQYDGAHVVDWGLLSPQDLKLIQRAWVYGYREANDRVGNPTSFLDSAPEHPFHSTASGYGLSRGDVYARGAKTYYLYKPDHHWKSGVELVTTTVKGRPDKYEWRGSNMAGGSDVVSLDAYLANDLRGYEAMVGRHKKGTGEFGPGARNPYSNPMDAKSKSAVTKRLRAMGVHKPYVSASGDTIEIESYPLEARIKQSLDPNEGPIHTFKIVDVHTGDTLTSGVVTLGQDLVHKVGQALLDFHGPAYAQAKEREARAMERRGNPESDAAALYETFHGAPSTETLELTQDIHYHSHLTVLGDLVELKVNTFTGKQATISFSADDPEGSTKLCSNEAGTQLYIEGGDQSLDLPALGFNRAQANRDSVAVGVLFELTYRAKKEFQKFKLTDYYHGLGEETGYEPILNYDTMNMALSVSGGEYKVKAEGIVN